MDRFSISAGFSASERDQVARLYWQAFGAKLGKTMGPTDKACAFLSASLDPAYAIVARNRAGRLLGLAGFKTSQGALVGGRFEQLSRAYGWFGAIWRAAFLSVLDRKVQDRVFQMDGIFVEASARSLGVGTRLLNAVAQEAARRGMHEVQLDVIDTNPRARALYEKVGFRAIGKEETGPFRHVFGFSSATRMSLDVNRNSG